MAIGDDAAAAGMDLVPGSTPSKDIDAEITKTRDYIAQKSVLKSAVTTVGNALLSAVSAAAARTAIGLTAMSAAVTANTIAQRDAAGNLLMQTGYAAGGTGPDPLHLATRGYVDDRVGSGAYLPLGGGTMSGHLLSPPARSTPVSTSYVAAYLNSDGRLGATPSARKFKKNIRRKVYTRSDAATIGALVSTYQLTKAVSGLTSAPEEVGVIAEELIAAGFPEFVAFDENGAPFSVHYERLALVALSALAQAAPE